LDRSESVDGLELDDQALRNQQVGPHVTHDLILVDDGHRGLPNERDAAKRPFQAERLLVDALEEARAEPPMHSTAAFRTAEASASTSLAGCSDPLAFLASWRFILSRRLPRG
jgi:hypothetical protein